jgi:hypothetical protein
MARAPTIASELEKSAPSVTTTNSNPIREALAAPVVT